MPALSVRGAVKRYGEITAVAGLDLEVADGTCVGLLGPNGAGKSTTMRLLTGQSVPDEGTIEVLGHRLPRRGRQAAVERAMGIGNLSERRDTRVDKLSGGMRRRLLIGRALVHRPRMVLLDEPTVGLDPQIRQELWGVIDRLRAEGVSILMSTHYIEEAERLADTVTIMSAGKAVATGKPAELVRRYAGAQVTEVYGPPDHLAATEASARDAGLKTRRTGTAVAVMGTESANGDGSRPEGSRAGTL